MWQRKAGKLNINAIDVNSWLSADSTVQQQQLAIPKLLTAPLKTSIMEQMKCS